MHIVIIYYISYYIILYILHYLYIFFCDQKTKRGIIPPESQNQIYFLHILEYYFIAEASKWSDSEIFLLTPSTGVNIYGDVSIWECICRTWGPTTHLPMRHVPMWGWPNFKPQHDSKDLMQKSKL